MKEPYYDKIKEILERFDLPFNENKRTQISFIKNNGDSLTKEEVKEFNKEIKELDMNPVLVMEKGQGCKILDVRIGI